MSYQAKRELLPQIAPRYREASSGLKEVILDEFVAATGYARKYAIRLLNHPAEQKLTITRPRPQVLQQQEAGHLAAVHIQISGLWTDGSRLPANPTHIHLVVTMGG